MGSKGRIPSHLWRPPPGSAMVHPDPYAQGVHHPPPGAFPPFDMMPSAEVMEQKLAAQHVEMQRLATENHRLAATHGTLREELAGAQHELHILHSQIGAVKSEREQQMRSLQEKIAKMETELQAAEPVKLELQQAQTEAQKLMVARQEQFSKIQQLSQDLQRAHTNVQQIPALLSELESLRQEYQHCRVTYDYEKKLYNDHLESLQVMEKNYIAMAREVEKVRTELMNVANVDKRTGGICGGQPGNNENEVSGRSTGQNVYEKGYVSQARGPLSAASGGVGVPAGGRTPTYGGPQSGPAPGRTAYDAARGPGYDVSAGPAYDAQRGNTYNIQREPNYDAQRAAFYDAQRGAYYDAQQGAYYNAQRGAAYDTSRGGTYDAQSRGVAVSQGHVTPTNNAPYGSTTPPTQGGSGHEAPRGGNPARK